MPMKVGVVGLGYVGLPLAVAFAEANCEVVGVDLNVERIETLVAGRSYIEDIPSAQIQSVSARLKPTVEYGELAAVDAVVIAVPTPLTVNREPDIGPLLAAAGSLSKVLQKDQLVVLESTTYPGTTRDELTAALAPSGLVAGRDFSLAFSPERIDPGRTDYTVRNTPKVIGGLTEGCGDRAESLYRLVCDEVVRVSSPEAAELTKLLENIFRSVNIALVNELAVLANRMEIDIWEVVDAASTKPFGFMRFDPGPGMGGHCLPVDPFYLSWKAREYDFSTEFIELAGKVNREMPYFCCDLVERGLNELGKPVKGSRVAILGVSYKAGVGDTRSSPALKLLELLKRSGADLVYHDAYVSALPELGLSSVPLTEAVEGADIAVVVTAHPGIDYGHTADCVPKLIDLRGITRGLGKENVISL